MFAYSPKGSPIVGTCDVLKGTAHIEEGSFTRNAAGKLEFDHGGGTNVDWDSQKTELSFGRRQFIDEDGTVWNESRIVLLEDELEGDLDPALVPPFDPMYRIGGTFILRQAELRDVASFSDEEAAMLRPVAETIGMLEDDALFGSVLDTDGDDAVWRRHLPKAAALMAKHGAWAKCASFARGPEPLAIALARHHAPEAETPVSLVKAPAHGSRVVRIEGIEWDFDDGEDDEAAGSVPTSLLAIVPADDGDPGQISDLLSDHFGFCVNSIASIVDQNTLPLAA